MPIEIFICKLTYRFQLVFYCMLLDFGQILYSFYIQPWKLKYKYHKNNKQYFVYLWYIGTFIDR